LLSRSLRRPLRPEKTIALKRRQDPTKRQLSLQVFENGTRFRTHQRDAAPTGGGGMGRQH